MCNFYESFSAISLTRHHEGIGRAIQAPPVPFVFRDGGFPKFEQAQAQPGSSLGRNSRAIICQQRM
jgi:hypothetical protein